MTMTSNTWARRGLWKLGAALAVTGAAVAGLPKLASAAKKDAKVKFKGKKNKGEAESEVKAAKDLGFLIMLNYGDEIDGLAVGGDDVTVNEWPEGSAPPLDPSGDVYEATIKIELFRRNPNCIRCTHGGKVIEVCNS